jgi:hypothetical protein
MTSPARAQPLAAAAILLLLVQALVGAPLASRMMLEGALAAPAETGEPLCTAHEAGREYHGPHDAPAPRHHDHEHCLLCQASATPLVVAGGVLLVMAFVADAVEQTGFLALSAPPACHAHVAEARAPPAR